MTGLALAISSLPTALKSKVHACFSGYLWTPQNVVPHRHLNPVNPTRFLHIKHRFGCDFAAAAVTVTAATSASAATWAAAAAGGGSCNLTSGKVNTGGGWGGRDSVNEFEEDDEEEAAEEEEEEERAISMEDLEEAWCCSSRWISL